MALLYGKWQIDSQDIIPQYKQKYVFFLFTINKAKAH